MFSRYPAAFSQFVCLLSCSFPGGGNVLDSPPCSDHMIRPGQLPLLRRRRRHSRELCSVSTCGEKDSGNCHPAMSSPRRPISYMVAKAVCDPRDLNERKCKDGTSDHFLSAGLLSLLRYKKGLGNSTILRKNATAHCYHKRTW